MGDLVQADFGLGLVRLGEEIVWSDKNLAAAWLNDAGQYSDKS